jgi:hypothetical protein
MNIPRPCCVLHAAILAPIRPSASNASSAGVRAVLGRVRRGGSSGGKAGSRRPAHRCRSVQKDAFDVAPTFKNAHDRRDIASNAMENDVGMRDQRSQAGAGPRLAHGRQEDAARWLRRSRRFPNHHFRRALAPPRRRKNPKWPPNRRRFQATKSIVACGTRHSGVLWPLQRTRACRVARIGHPAPNEP